MTKRRIALVIAVVFPIATLYLFPVGYIVFVTARGLPQETQSQPPNIQVVELDSTHSGILLRASEFEASQVSNEPFPAIITGHSPGSHPEIPLPRIRSALSVYRDWYSTTLTTVYFPVIILAGGGPVLFGIVAIAVLSGVFKPLVAWRRITGSVAWAFLLISLIAITYLLAIWPRVIREYYGKHRPLIWEDSPLTHYLEGGFSVDPKSRAQPTRTRLVVVNGTASPVEVFADGLRFDKVPAKGIRGYRRLRDFSRLTAVDSSTRSLLDDFCFHESGERNGILIYNVHGADTLRIEGPPTYR